MQAQTFPLRPLGIGEIFDRAVTIYVRNFVPFTLMVLTLLAPIAILQYFVIPDQAGSLAQILGGKSTGGLPSNRELAGLFAIGGLALIFAPFVNNAVAVGVARIYNGSAPAYGPSFATVFRRWLPLIGTAVLNILLLGALYMCAVFALVLVLTIGLLVVKAAPAIGIALFVLGIVCGLAVLLAFLLLLIAYAFAMYATSLEDASPAQAIALAYRRLFNRKEFKKALLMALAYVGLELGVLMLSAIVGTLLLFLTKSYALQIGVNAVVSAMLTAFLTILLAVYYYDVRTRAEALDLETDLQRLAIPAQ